MSQPSYRFAAPKATQEQLRRRAVWDTCQNLYLLLHQYLPREAIEGKPEAKKNATDNAKDRERERSGKVEWLIHLAMRAPSELDPLFNGELHAAWLRRWDTLTTSYRARTFRAETTSRLVVGLGGQSALETDMLVHPVYGLPYIPGSALKGVARAYVEVEVLPEAQDRETLRATIERIFGGQKRSGSVIFFDGIPEPDILLDVDIMNPHYPDYYRDTTNETPPSDDQNPIPVPFLTVAAFCTFRFALAPRPGGWSQEEAERVQADVEMAVGWLQLALREYGVGAKTNAGYGRFEVM